MKTLKVFGAMFLALVFVLTLAGCPTQGEPRDRYYELEQKAKTDPRAAKRLKKFEAAIEPAYDFYAAKDACIKESSTYWFCLRRGTGMTRENRSAPPPDAWETVKRYRKDRTDCGCVARGTF